MKVKSCLDAFYYSVLEKIITGCDLAKHKPVKYFSDIPIKFRFWMCVGVLEPFMMYSDDEYYDNNLTLFFKHFEQYSDGNLMICTGAQDKKQKDIYTGDIISLYTYRENYRTKSKYDKKYKIYAQVGFNPKTQKYEFKLSENQRKRICNPKGLEQYDRDLYIGEPYCYFYEYYKKNDRYWFYEEKLKNKDKYSEEEIKKSYNQATEWDEQDGCLIEGNIYENKELLD